MPKGLFPVVADGEQVPERIHERLDAGVLAEQHEGCQAAPRVGGELARSQAVVAEDPRVEVMQVGEAETGLERGSVDADGVGAHRRRLAGCPPQVAGVGRPELLGHPVPVAQGKERGLAG